MVTKKIFDLRFNKGSKSMKRGQQIESPNSYDKWSEVRHEFANAKKDFNIK